MNVSALATPSNPITTTSEDNPEAEACPEGSCEMPGEEFPYWEEPPHWWTDDWWSDPWQEEIWPDSWQWDDTEEGDWADPSYEEEQQADVSSVCF